jgi:hypothetical protein
MRRAMKWGRAYQARAATRMDGWGEGVGDALADASHQRSLAARGKKQRAGLAWKGRIKIVRPSERDRQKRSVLDRRAPDRRHSRWRLSRDRGARARLSRGAGQPCTHPSIHPAGSVETDGCCCAFPSSYGEQSATGRKACAFDVQPCTATCVCVSEVGGGQEGGRDE